MATDELLTLTEAATMARCTVEAIRQRIKRKKLNAIKGNDGRLRVRLTDADIEALHTGRSNLPVGRQTGQPAGDSGTIKALEDHIQTLREQLERQRADHAVERDRLSTELAEERNRFHDLIDRLDQLHRKQIAETDQYRQEIEALRVELMVARQRWWRPWFGPKA